MLRGEARPVEEQMLTAGIDPGLSGGIAFLADDGTVETHDMPIHRLVRGGKVKGEIDAHALADMFWKRHVEHVFVERVGAMPS
jgi:hypothetical protein